MAATAVTATATEEEEFDGCNGATPDAAWTTPSSSWRTGSSSARLPRQRWAPRRRRSPATATTSMPVINIDALFIGREDREGDDGSGVATEDDGDTDAEAGGYARDFLEVILRRLWEGRLGMRRTTTKTTETSRDKEHKEDVMTWSMFETLCKGKPLSSSSKARPKRRSPETTAARAGGVDPSWTKRSRTGQGWRQRRNRGCVGDDNDYKRLPYIQQRDDAHNNIL